MAAPVSMAAEIRRVIEAVTVIQGQLAGLADAVTKLAARVEALETSSPPAIEGNGG